MRKPVVLDVDGILRVSLSVVAVLIGAEEVNVNLLPLMLADTPPLADT